MAFTNSTAASLGLLVMRAMDMYRSEPQSMTPTPSPALSKSGWTLLAYVTGQDALLSKGPLKVDVKTVCYGYVARKNVDEFVVAIRGTDGFVEWVEDGEFAPVPYAPAFKLPPGQGPVFVEQGFWAVYSTMGLVSPSGVAIAGTLAQAVANMVGAAGKVTVLGHSLGAALATYLAIDLARGALGDRASGCLFASPYTGDQAFADLFDKSVDDYRLFNYALDLVPKVPFGLGYAALPRCTIIRPATAEARIRFEIACNHHVVCYCAMLDYEGTRLAITPVPAGEETSAPCILGPETGRPSLSKLMLSALSATLPA